MKREYVLKNNKFSILTKIKQNLILAGRGIIEEKTDL